MVTEAAMVRHHAFVTKPTLVMKAAWAKKRVLETQVLSMSLQLLVMLAFVGICSGSLTATEVVRVSERVKTMKVILRKGAGT